MATEFIAFGNRERSGHTAFMLLGSHYTEIPNAQLIPLDAALHVLLEFHTQGTLSPSVTWEENTF